MELSAQGEGDSKVVGPQEKVGLPFGRRVENLFFSFMATRAHFQMGLDSEARGDGL